MTRDEYLKEVMHMLQRQKGDYHIGRNQREVIAMCADLERPVGNCVGLLMRLAINSVD